MPDVFISYARSTEAQAERIDDALRALGYDVWRDDELPAHQAYTKVLDEKLTAAKAVVVVWSAEAVESEWVQSEADRARKDRKLVQLTIDGTQPPMPFDRIQCASLVGWMGDPNAPGWRKVMDSVEALARAPKSAASDGSSAEPARSPERRLAVLAFDNLSPDPEMNFFSDGVSEEILETVARNTDLTVIARASSFQFRGPAKAARRVASELNVSHLLDGSVRRSGSKVRVSAQLVECATEARIWSERFDRDLEDVFALQDEIAAAVAAALKAEFARAGRQPGKLDPAAYDLFLRARDPTYERPGTEPIQELEQCVALAPDFALAWAWLAFGRANLAVFGRRRAGVELEPLVDAARAALATAERLDPSLGLTRVVRALLEPRAAYQRREDLFGEALRLTPGDTVCLTFVADFHGEVGRCREALSLMQEAKSRDPQNPAPIARWLVMLEERYEEQSAGFDAARAKWPGVFDFSVTAANYAAVNEDWPRYEMLKRHAYAQTFPIRARAMHGAFRFFDAIRDGDQVYLDRRVQSWTSQIEQTGSVDLSRLCMMGGSGHADAAFEAVERASFDGAFKLGHDPAAWWAGTLFQRRFAAALIDDPQFLRLCAKLGLVSYWLETDKWPDCADEVPYDFRAQARKVAAEGLARRA